MCAQGHVYEGATVYLCVHVHTCAVHVRICVVHVCMCCACVYMSRTCVYMCCACVRVHEGACVRVCSEPSAGSVQVALGRCASGLHAPVSSGHGWEVGAGTRRPHVQPPGSLQAFGLWPDTAFLMFDVCSFWANRKALLLREKD